MKYVMGVVLALWCSWVLAADPPTDTGEARQQDASAEHPRVRVRVREEEDQGREWGRGRPQGSARPV